MGRTARSEFVQRMEDGTFWVTATPTGAVDGSNKTFVLPSIPNPLSSLELKVNGQDLKQDTGYTIVGDTITTKIAFPENSVKTFVAHYRVEPS